MKKVVFGLCVLAVLIGVCSCKTPDLVKTVVEKAYKLVLYAENFVNTTDDQTFISKAKSLNTPLSVLSTALTFIAPYIKDEGVKDAIDKAVVTINDLTTMINNITPEQVQTVRAKTVATLNDSKSVIERIAKLLDIPLDNVKALISDNQTALDLMILTAKDIEVDIDRAK